MTHYAVVSIWCLNVLATSWSGTCIADTPIAIHQAKNPETMPDVPREAIKTASGLAMLVLATGTGKDRPKPNDCVRLRFVARAKDGAIFARSAADSSPDIECVRQLTPGVSETVRQMVVDEQRRAWVPARLNATTVDSGEAPARAIDLIYEITLVGIIKAPPTPSPLKSPAAGARKLPSGVAVKWLSKGAGKVHPAPSNRVSLHQTSWTTDGALFESTVMAGQPATYVVAELLPGVRDGVEQLVVGDRARFWIPAELAYGKKPKRRGQPAGNLVYDVELLSLE